MKEDWFNHPIWKRMVRLKYVSQRGLWPKGTMTFQKSSWTLKLWNQFENSDIWYSFKHQWVQRHMNGEILVTFFKVFSTTTQTSELALSLSLSKSLGVFQSVLEAFRVFHIIAKRKVLLGCSMYFPTGRLILKVLKSILPSKNDLNLLLCVLFTDFVQSRIKIMERTLHMA